MDNRLPVLTVKDVIVFPYLYMPLSIGREFSKKAIFTAIDQHNSNILVHLQRDPEMESPSEIADIYTTGALCKIIKMDAVPKTSSYKLLLQGIDRVELFHLEKKDDVLMGAVKTLNKIQLDLKQDKNKTLYESFLKDLVFLIEKGFFSENLVTIKELENPIATCYVLLSILQKPYANQKILEAEDTLYILNQTYREVLKQKELVSWRESIIEQARDSMTKNQKEYFLKEQMRVIKKELGEDQDSEADAYSKKLEEIKKHLSEENYKELQKGIKKIQNSFIESQEISVLKNYLDYVFDLPWYKKTEDTLNIIGVKKSLDKNHYDLTEVKERILEFLSVKKLNSASKGPILCFLGPPGSGKTSVAKALAKAIGRKCIRISLGGIKDEAEIRGHRRCIKDAYIISKNKSKIKIEDYVRDFEKGDQVLNGQNEYEDVLDFYEQVTDKTIKIKTERGFELEGTPDHPISVAYRVGELENITHSFKRLDELCVNDFILSCITYDYSDNCIPSTQEIFEKDKIISKEIIEKETKVYDLVLPDTHSFWSNGFISHNTYVGSMPGKIMQGMKQAGVINPVFILDEIDKLSSDFRGDPSSALLEVLDPEQNHTFRDHYINLEYDLSKVMFIATANNLETIPAALIDRLEIIKISGYCEEEKIEIAKKFIVPRKTKDSGLKGHKDVSFSREVIKSIIRDYTKEFGVRELERQISKICRKIAKKKAENIITDPTTLSPDNVHNYLGAPKFNSTEDNRNDVGVATGLAWTQHGGEILKLESILIEEKGDTILTGRLGEVMQESAKIAISLIKRYKNDWNIPPGSFEDKRLHIHAPTGDVPKEGPSAGVALMSSMISCLKNKKIKDSIAMTGEITLTGKVLPVGGIKEKVLAAIRSNISMVILPKDNQKDFEIIPDFLTKKIEIKYVSHVTEALNILEIL